MRVLLVFIAGIILAISTLAADLELDGCAQWIGQGVQICKQEEGE